MKNISGKHGVEIGGFGVHSSRRRVVVCATIDNLLKGAATQCLREWLLNRPPTVLNMAANSSASITENMNLAKGYAEFEGIPRD